MMGNIFGPVPSIGFLLVLLALALLAVGLVARYLGWRPPDRRLSGSPPVGNRVSHGAEAIVLLCDAAAIFVFAATNTSTGGCLLILDQLRPGFALVNVLAAVAAGLGVLLGVLMALFGRTTTGVITAAGILCAYGLVLNAYGLVLNGPELILESLAPKDSTAPEVSLTFVLRTPDVAGAELYVNDVHLGTLPYETTYDKFYQRAPFWENEPTFLALGERDVDFLFLDLDSGSRSLTLRYWPRFKEAATQEKHAALSRMLPGMSLADSLYRSVEIWKSEIMSLPRGRRTELSWKQYKSPRVA
jgi:hypothetical protein